MNSKIVIGKIINTRGLKGELIILSYAQSREGFLEYQEYFIKSLETFKPLKVEKKGHYKGNRFVFKVKEITSLEQAEALKNQEIYIDTSQLEPLQEKKFYYESLLDAQVFIEEKFLGLVKQVFNFGSCDIIEVQNNETLKTHNLPLLNQYLKELSVENKKVVFFDIEDLI